LDDRHILIAGDFFTPIALARIVLFTTPEAIGISDLAFAVRRDVNLVQTGDFVYCLGGEDRMKHRSSACYRIRWRELLSRASDARRADHFRPLDYAIFFGYLLITVLVGFDSQSSRRTSKPICWQGKALAR